MNKLQLSGTKLIHHLEILDKWKKGEAIYPVFVEVSPTDACNHKCVFCAYDYLERKHNVINAEKLKNTFSELQKLGTKAIFYSGEGEPLLHKKFPDLIEYAAKIGFDQALNTNGVLLSYEKMMRIIPHMSWIRTSVNGVSETDYANVHKVDKKYYKVVLNNIETAAKFSKQNNLKTAIGVQCVYLNQPITELELHIKRIRDTGINYVSIKQFNEHPSNPFKLKTPLPDPQELKALETLSTNVFQVSIRLELEKREWKRPYTKCLALPFFAEIVANGDVYACGPHLGEKEFCYGNIYETDFETLWSTQGRSVVEKHVCSIKDLDKTCMPNCRLDQINRLLWDLKNPPDHINFI